ncbi:MAG: CdaR family protein [Anaerolineae bacterium]
MRQLMDNLGAFILALLLAFVIWIAATLQDDPFQVQEFPNVSVDLVDMPQDAVLFEEIDKQVSVTVRAPKTVLQDLKESNFQATMNLAKVEPGVRTSVPISVTCDTEGVQMQSIEPAKQDVHLEVIRTITLPIALEVRGEAATGYHILQPVITPDQVAVQGPAPLLTEVISVTGLIDVDMAKETIVRKVIVTPLGADGKPVPGLQWAPDRVEVRVGVHKKVGYKPDVEVVPDLRGEPEAGYRLGSVTVLPSTVTLVGLPSVLDNLPSFVETLPISVTGATQNLSVRSLLTVPANVVVVDANYVKVMVEVLPIQSSRAMTDVVEVQGVRPEWQATPSPKIVDVILEGPDAVLAELTSDDIQVTVNVFGLAPGVHRLPLEVLEPEGVTVVSVIPETIEVVIEVAPTLATPTPPVLQPTP